MRNLKIKSLPSNKKWVDRDEIMLHACFQIMQDCIDEENVDTHCDYESNKEFVDEIRNLSKWWKERLKKNSDNQMKEDDEMLSRLIKIRTLLWI